MTPSIGRIVHYVSYGTPGGEYPKACRAAIITEVTGQSGQDGELVGPCVLNPTGMFFNQGVIHAEHPAAHLGGTWHWPEPVDAPTSGQFTVTTSPAAAHTTVRCTCGGLGGSHLLGCPQLKVMSINTD